MFFSSNELSILLKKGYRMALTDTKVIGVLKKSDEQPILTKDEEIVDSKVPNTEQARDSTESKQSNVSDSIEKPANNETIIEDEELLFGPDSHKWQLMAILVDGKNKKKVLDKNGNPKGIVGYKIKALEDGLPYVHSKIESTLLSNPFAVPETEDKVASKDEVVIFTKAEVGRLLAAESMDCVISGGGVIAVLAFGKPITSQVEEGKEMTELPFRPYLKGTRTSGKLAEQVPIESILDVTAEPDPNNPKKSNMVQKINSGFERFEPVLAEKPKQAERRKVKEKAKEQEGQTMSAQSPKSVSDSSSVQPNSSTVSKSETKTNHIASASNSIGSKSKSSAKHKSTTSVSKESKAVTSAAKKRNAARRKQAELYLKAFDSKRS